MFDLGWSEIAVIAVVALVVIGPKDLPVVLRTVGQYVRKARAMAAEFQSSIEQMARDAELEQMRKELEAAQQNAATQAAAVQEQIEQALDTPVAASDPPVIEAPPAETAEPTTETSTHARPS